MALTLFSQWWSLCLETDPLKAAVATCWGPHSGPLWPQQEDHGPSLPGSPCAAGHSSPPHGGRHTPGSPWPPAPSGTVCSAAAGGHLLPLVSAATRPPQHSNGPLQPPRPSRASQGFTPAPASTPPQPPPPSRQAPHCHIQGEHVPGLWARSCVVGPPCQNHTSGGRRKCLRASPVMLGWTVQWAGRGRTCLR